MGGSNSLAQCRHGSCMAQDVKITLLDESAFHPKVLDHQLRSMRNPPRYKLKKLKIERRRWWCCQNNDRKQIIVSLMQRYRATPAVSHVKVGLEAAENEETLINERANCQWPIPLLERGTIPSGDGRGVDEQRRRSQQCKLKQRQRGHLRARLLNQ